MKTIERDMRRHMNTSVFVCLYVCLGLTSFLNIWGHITTVSACSSGTLTNVLPHRNAMPQTQDTTPHTVTVYRHGVDLSLCYRIMWNVTPEYTATHFNVLGETRPSTHTSERSTSCWSWTRDLWCANPVRYPLAHSDFLNTSMSYWFQTHFTVL